MVIQTTNLLAGAEAGIQEIFNTKLKVEDRQFNALIAIACSLAVLARAVLSDALQNEDLLNKAADFAKKLEKE